MSENKKIIKYLIEGNIKELTLFLYNNPGNYNLNLEDNVIMNIIGTACKNDNVLICKLLLGISSNIDIHHKDELIFRYACQSGAFKIAEWVYLQGDTNISINDNDAFFKACYSNNAELILWLHGKIKTKIDYHKNNDELFRTCCQQNLVEAVLVLTTLTTFKLNIDKKFNDRFKYENEFHFFCRYGYIDIAKKYLNIKDFPIQSKTNEAICLACQEGHLEMAKWLYSLGANIYSQDNWCFEMGITRNNLELLKWIHSLGKIDIHKDGEYYFRYCCTLGKLDIAKWIYSLGDVNVHIYFDHAFISACVEGQIETVKWLYSLGGINIHDEDDKLFKFICQRGNLLIAQWLYSLGDIDIHSENDFAFRIACQSNNLNIAKWLFSLGNVNIKADRNQAFIYACSNQNIDIALWLKSINYDEYYLEIIDDIITNFRIIKVLKLEGVKLVDEIDDCPICFTSKSNVITNCNHQFCQSCFKKYADKQPDSISELTCPYCRQNNLKFYEIKKKMEE